MDTTDINQLIAAVKDVRFVAKGCEMLFAGHHLASLPKLSALHTRLKLRKNDYRAVTTLKPMSVALYPRRATYMDYAIV